MEVSYSYSYMALASTTYLLLLVSSTYCWALGVLLGAGVDQRGSADTNSLIGRSALSPPWRLVEVGRKVERQQRKVMVRLGQEREASSGS